MADATVFEFALSKNDRPTLFFIDGLDEYEGYKAELLSLIDKLTKFKVKVCLSSRYEKPFTTTFRDLDFQFRMEVLNQPGIYAYAKAILETTLRPSDKKGRSVLDTACKDIAQSSSGVFLWAHFAVSEVIDRMCEGYKIEERWIRTIVNSMPPELEDVYARMFQSMKDKDKNASGIILALIDSAAGSDLEISELFEAALLAGNAFRSLDENINAEDLGNFRRYLETVGAGLIHCFGPNSEDDEDDDSAERYVFQPVIYVTMIHRSLKTYLDSAGWRQLFGEQRAADSHHELWLNICHDYLAGKHVKWIAPAGLQDDIRGGFSQPTDQIELAGSIVGLRIYVNTFLPHHAYRYEQETAKSSRPLIQEVLDPQFVQEHFRMTLQRISRVSCFDCMALVEDLNHVTVHCSDVQLAISHALRLYVDEALSDHLEAFKSDSFVSAVVVADSTLKPPGDEFHVPNQHSGHARASEECATLPLDGPRASPLASAVFWQCRQPSSEFSMIILLLAPHSSRLKDVDILMAIRKLSMLEIEALLIHFPNGPLYLCSTVLNHNIAFYGHWFQESNRMATEQSYGPLWEVVRRDDVESIAELLRFFLNRGENINSRCGPRGTVFHSVAENQLLFADYYRSGEELEFVFGILIAHGADIQATGPEGNVLEYVWKGAHVEYYGDSGVLLGSFTSLVKSLIKMGATNSARDPNGMIPSKARMLAVAKAGTPCEEDVDYYFHGRCSDSELEVYFRELDGLS